MSNSAEDRDMLAAEFVLGTLERHDARAVELMAENDQELAEAIAAWQERLAPLSRIVPERAPPAGLWARLEESTAPAVLAFPSAKQRSAGRAWRSAAVWRGTTAGALAMAAAFAGIAFIHAPPERSQRPVFVAELEPSPVLAVAAPEAAGHPAPSLAQAAASSSADHATVQPSAAQPGIAVGKAEGFEQSAAAPAQPSATAGSTLEPAQPSEPPPSMFGGFVVASTGAGAILVKPIGQMQLPPGKEMELWALPPGASRPSALGELPPGGTRLAAPALGQANTKLIVSLEPAGSAPSAPTGRVLFSGVLTPLQ